MALIIRHINIIISSLRVDRKLGVKLNAIKKNKLKLIINDIIIRAHVD